MCTSFTDWQTITALQLNLCASAGQWYSDKKPSNESIVVLVKTGGPRLLLPTGEDTEE
jgi:hypothetical protein